MDFLKTKLPMWIAAILIALLVTACSDKATEKKDSGDAADNVEVAEVEAVVEEEGFGFANYVPYTLTGSIGEYPVEMVLEFVNGDVVNSAKYRYTASGSGDWIDLEPDYYKGYYLFEEYNHGKSTGSWAGPLDVTGNTITYEGTFTNAKGKQLSFRLSGFRE